MKEAVLEFDQLCQDYIGALYHNASGFISYEPGEKESHAEKQIFLTYGEILYPSVNTLIEHMDITEDDVFYDFGSGIGKVALQYFLKTPIKKAGGIEFSEKRNEVAIKVYEQVKEEFPELFLNNRQLTARQGNFLELDISDATIIYSCSTCFSEELLASMGELFNRCPKLRYIASLKPIPSNIPLDSTIEIDCTWDKTKCYFYSIYAENKPQLDETDSEEQETENTQLSGSVTGNDTE